MTQYTFYATFGSGQPGYPGYLECVVEAESKADAEIAARKRIADATDNRWCGLYDDITKLHELDSVYRGQA